LLSPGDIIIDGGNSEYQDTARRVEECKKHKLLFVGSGNEFYERYIMQQKNNNNLNFYFVGVSGGEEGARYGPSLMPGGNPDAWPHIKDIFQSICAKSGSDPCCEWVGEGGSGHFVKMVHNGIEYGDMQLICEAYDLMKSMGMSQKEMADTFTEWNKGELDSFLIEITSSILNYKDKDGYLLERIRDSAGQKGTGKWTAIAALQYGVPVTLIGEAVFARCLSALKSERVAASKVLKGPDSKPTVANRAEFLNHIKNALYCAKIISYAQGFMLMREAAKDFGWHLNYGGIALMWRGGCIIRSVFLGNIKEAFTRNPQLSNLLLDDFFKAAITKNQHSWRQVVANATLWGIPVPTLSAALAFFDGYRSERLPANLLQAQRDFFGAHTYELLGHEGKFVHTNWTGTGGNVSASSYNA
jgi:6-phosphogluconate dehydrogenase